MMVDDVSCFESSFGIRLSLSRSLSGCFSPLFCLAAWQSEAVRDSGGKASEAKASVDFFLDMFPTDASPPVGVDLRPLE